MWSLGVTLYTLITTEAPFTGIENSIKGEFEPLPSTVSLGESSIQFDGPCFITIYNYYNYIYILYNYYNYITIITTSISHKSTFMSSHLMNQRS